MPPQPTPTQHHFPSREQNLFYILILIVSPAVNLLVNSLVYADFHALSAEEAAETFGLFHWFFGGSSFLMGCVLIMLGVNLTHALLARHRQLRKSLFVFGLFSSLYLLINLLTISYGILRFKVESLFLLFVSICVYLSLNIIFSFWYWFVDYPTQLRRLHHHESTPEISFPISSQRQQDWVPDFLDYLYFSVLTSNTLGPPENHSPTGRKAKTVVLIHSLVMLVVLVIFVSRAINTL